MHSKGWAPLGEHLLPFRDEQIEHNSVAQLRHPVIHNSILNSLNAHSSFKSQHLRSWIHYVSPKWLYVFECLPLGRIVLYFPSPSIKCSPWPSHLDGYLGGLNAAFLGCSAHVGQVGNLFNAESDWEGLGGGCRATFPFLTCSQVLLLLVREPHFEWQQWRGALLFLSAHLTQIPFVKCF